MFRYIIMAIFEDGYVQPYAITTGMASALAEAIDAKKRYERPCVIGRPKVYIKRKLY